MNEYHLSNCECGCCFLIVILLYIPLYNRYPKIYFVETHINQRIFGRRFRIRNNIIGLHTSITRKTRETEQKRSNCRIVRCVYGFYPYLPPRHEILCRIRICNNPIRFHYSGTRKTRKTGKTF